MSHLNLPCLTCLLPSPQSPFSSSLLYSHHPSLISPLFLTPSLPCIPSFSPIFSTSTFHPPPPISFLFLPASHTWSHSRPQGIRSWRWWRRCVPHQSQSPAPAAPPGQAVAMKNHPPAWSLSHRWSASAPPSHSDGSMPERRLEKEWSVAVWNGRWANGCLMFILGIDVWKYEMI